MTQPTDRTTLLARRLRVDIDMGTFPAVNYQELVGRRELNPISETRAQDDEGYEDDGAAREATTGYSWRLELKLSHSTNAAGTSLNPVHAFLRQKHLLAQTQNVAAGEFGVRWYDKDGLASGEEFAGRCYVKQWSRDSNASPDLEVVTVVLQGQGQRVPITNPNADLTPAITGLMPATGDDGGGYHVSIFGQHFSGATDVDFGANAADDFTVVSDNHIVATAPAGTAGTVRVTVETPEGVSPNVPADDFVYTA
ncbi:phage tail tube protein [Micromonospora sp. NPDC003816]|uniref:phage tail tube protein n=1 Tax=Micromonospora sp. NPDC003816 TaxID=3364224 RepID=UPI0036C254E5